MIVLENFSRGERGGDRVLRLGVFYFDRTLELFGGFLKRLYVCVFFVLIKVEFLGFFLCIIRVESY